MTPNIMLDDLILDRDSAESMSQQISRQIRTLILSGAIEPQTRLPSIRDLARRLSISRNTVAESYASLISDGMAYTQQGAGTYISNLSASGSKIRNTRPQELDAEFPQISESARMHLTGADLYAVSDPKCLLTPGVPALEHFPYDRWNRSVAAGLREGGSALHWNADMKGLRSLRSTISAHVGASRGVICSPDQILILSSARQAIELAVRVMTETGDMVAIENPSYRSALEIIRANGRNFFPCRVDHAGIIVSDLPKTAKLAFVTPVHQFPLGHRMSEARRRELLQWARDTQSCIIEDDYDGEFSHEKTPIPSLASEDPGNENTIYIGTFSKSLFPALRVAFMVISKRLVSTFTAIRAMMDGQAGVVSQAGLATFIKSGAYTSHLRNMRQLYHRRRIALEHSMQSQCGHKLEIVSTSPGLHICVAFNNGVNDVAVEERLREAGIGAFALSSYFIGEGPSQSGLVIGYADTKVEQMRDLATRIRELL